PPITHAYAPVLHCMLPPAFMQSDKLPDGQHTWPSHGSVSLSSIRLLQSLSTPSHTSGDGPTDPEHTFAPFTQIANPGLHWPTHFVMSPIGHASPQTCPTSIGFSST